MVHRKLVLSAFTQRGDRIKVRARSYLSTTIRAEYYKLPLGLRGIASQYILVTNTHTARGNYI